jgi:hypothetical protein
VATSKRKIALAPGAREIVAAAARRAPHFVAVAIEHEALDASLRRRHEHVVTGTNDHALGEIVANLHARQTLARAA